MLEEKIAAAHSGWSEIPFCLTQDGFHSEISEDQYRIKMEKARREERKKGERQCVEWTASEEMSEFCCCVCFQGFHHFQIHCYLLMKHIKSFSSLYNMQSATKRV